ncbi:MAG: tetratricopeptide repeat protein [Pseudomonadota bacterium]
MSVPNTAFAQADDPLVVRDPHYGEVLFHFYSGDYFNALVKLTAAQQQELLMHHDDEAELLRGGLLLSYGQHTEAGAVFDRLLASNTRPEVRDRTWFFMAKIRYQRGYVDAAGEALAAIGDELPKELQAEKRMLQAQVYIDQSRFDDAIALLDGWRGPKGWADYARFNLGVALVRSGEFAQGAKWLERVGRLSDDRDEMRGLRDKANVALGYTWLQNEQPERARPILQRVRLNGAFSNKALLGVGWADSDRGDFKAALTPWNELASRDLLDPAVQESLLAVPYALGKLNATRQAAAQYETAIVAFAKEQQRLTDAIASIETGEMLERLLFSEEPTTEAGWYWKLDEMPDATESRYLYHLMATHEFQEALKNYRDVLELRRNLVEWQSKVVVFRDILATRTQGYAERLPRIEQTLAESDIDEIRSRQAAMQARLSRIKADGDVIAVATKREQRLSEELAEYELNPVLSINAPEIEDVRTRLKLMRGVLQWQAEKDFPARVWHQQKQIDDITRILVAAERARLTVDDARVNEPARLLDFNERIEGLTPLLEQKLVEVERSLQQQRDFLHGLAIDELQAQQKRLDTYTVQARFALAAVYDRATSASSGESGSQP